MTPVKETVRELVAQELETRLFPERNALAKERKGATVRVLGDLCRVHTAGNPEEAQATGAEFRKRWEKVHPEVAASWEFSFLGEKLLYPKCERQESPWERRLQGLMEAQEGREKTFRGSTLSHGQ